MKISELTSRSLVACANIPACSLPYPLLTVSQSVAPQTCTFLRVSRSSMARLSSTTYPQPWKLRPLVSTPPCRMAFAKSCSWPDSRSDDITVMLNTLLKTQHRAENRQTMVSDYQLHM